MTDERCIPRWFDEYRKIVDAIGSAPIPPTETTEDQQRRLGEAVAELERLRGQYWPGI